MGKRVIRGMRKLVVNIASSIRLSVSLSDARARFCLVCLLLMIPSVLGIILKRMEGASARLYSTQKLGIGTKEYLIYVSMSGEWDKGRGIRIYQRKTHKRYSRTYSLKPAYPGMNLCSQGD